MSKRMVENDDQEILQLIDKYSDEIKKIVINGNLKDFKQYVKHYNQITKEIIHAFIYYNYTVGISGMFGSADVADAILEALDVLDVSETINLIEKIYNLYLDSGVILYDTTRILVRLHIETMTVKDVIEEERQISSSKDFSKTIDKYLEYLENGLCFKKLYNIMIYDYNVFKTDNSKQTNITSHEDAIQKIKALYCSKHIYYNKKKD